MGVVMIDGLKHTEIILKILSDGRPHFSREFFEAGLLEYRRRLTELRREGHQIQSVRIGKRPGYILQFRRDLFETAA